MANRIRIAQDKASFVQSLVVNNHNLEGIFNTYADVMAMAAAVGKKYQYRLPIDHVAKEPSPISIEVFLSRGYDLLIKILAITETKDPTIISSYTVDGEEKRILIFEEYANGGLAQLQEQLKGAVDYQERILLLLNQQRLKISSPPENFDLTRFL
jgi:dnd system-associated protein 4